MKFPFGNRSGRFIVQFLSAASIASFVLSRVDTIRRFSPPYAIVFSFVQVEPVPLDVHIVGIFIGAACFFPLTRWIAARNGSLPMFEMICVAYWLAFGLPIYTQNNDIIIYSQITSFTWDETFSTLCVALLGIVFFIVGYDLLNRWRGWANMRRRICR